MMRSPWVVLGTTLMTVASLASRAQRPPDAAAMVALPAVERAADRSEAMPLVQILTRRFGRV